jgi:hypothetical protein
MGQIQNKKINSFLILGILIIIGALLIYNYYLKPKEKFENKIETKEERKTVFSSPPLKVEVTQPGSNKILEAFPEDILQEKDAQIINSYEVNIENNSKQYILKYLSRKSSQESMKIYSDHLLKNQWAIIKIPTYENGVARALFVKDKNTLEIISAYDSIKRQNVVTLTLTRLPGDK